MNNCIATRYNASTLLRYTNPYRSPSNFDTSGTGYLPTPTRSHFCNGGLGLIQSTFSSLIVEIEIPSVTNSDRRRFYFAPLGPIL